MFTRFKFPTLSRIATSNVPSVNIHITKYCDLNCRFCFAQFNDVEGFLPKSAWLEIIALLSKSGTGKVNFAGGEPTLYRGIGDVVDAVHRHQMTASIVSNGALLEPLMREHRDAFTWIGLSVDSWNEETQALLGRGDGSHVGRSVRLADIAHELGLGVKLNSVVTSLNVNEDLGPLVRAMAPERWKALQVLEIVGENSDTVGPLLITAAEFATFVARHRAQGLDPVAETNEAILESYLMIDPLGRFFSDSGQRHTYSDPILDVGVERALEQIVYDKEKTAARGGFYAWTRPRAAAPFIALEGLDAVGKTTIARALATRVGGAALDTPGQALRAIRPAVHEGLRHDQNARATFYAASVVAQGQAARELTGAGTFVAMDRYWPSTVANAAARGATIDLSSLAASVHQPDETILLTLDEPERQRRLRDRGCTAEDAETLDEGYRATVLRAMRDPALCPGLTISREIDVTGKTVEEVVDEILGGLPGQRQQLVTVGG